MVKFFDWFKAKPPLSLGQQGEKLAQAAYRKKGFAILESNYFNRRGKRLGEIDFICKNKEAIIFVEVKTRTQQTGQFGSGAEAVDKFKQQKFLKAVKIYLQQHPEHRALRPSIDVCVVELTAIDKSAKSVMIIPNAVEDWM
jgi:putative endonuclease